MQRALDIMVGFLCPVLCVAQINIFFQEKYGEHGQFLRFPFFTDFSPAVVPMLSVPSDSSLSVNDHLMCNTFFCTLLCHFVISPLSR